MASNTTDKRIDDLKKYMKSCGFKQRVDVINNKQERDIIYQKEDMLIHFIIKSEDVYLVMSRQQFRNSYSGRKLLIDDTLISNVSNGIY